MAIPRQIAGPQEQYERTGAQSYRDIRPFTTRLSEGLRSSASGLVLGGFAAATVVEPAVVNLTVPVSALYALWVLTRRVILPIRLPASAARPDHNDPEPGSRKPRWSDGTQHIGNDINGHELWASGADFRHHISIPGTTGAGKTTTILSLLTNALAQGSGFVLVDAKADRELFAKVMGLARRFGRDDDVRVLNFMVASGLRESHTFNPFAIGTPDAIKELLVSLLGEQKEGDPNGVFRGRAQALLGTITPVLVWLRDHKGVPLNVELIRSSLELPWIWKLAMEKIVELRDPETGQITKLNVDNEISEELTWPLRSYLAEVPGYDATIPLEKQRGGKPFEQHGYAQFYFTEMFTQLTVSLAHIFRPHYSDIDMRDVVLNRRILVVNLPALDNSDATLAALGKLVVASLRGMMAQLLGVSLEGDYTPRDKPGMGPTPFPIVLDELAYYATSGLDRMLAMGRGLNICFMLGFQEVSGIWARLGEKTASLLGNANLTIAMRQQDAGRTREWIEHTAGQTNVTQATSYQGAADGAYREARHADVRTVSRIDWRDLTSLNEGEAIILFGGRRIYARIFHAKIDDSGPKRLGRTLMLPAPDPSEMRVRAASIAAIAKTIATGRVTPGIAERKSPALVAMVRAFAEAAFAGSDGRTCARAAIDALGRLPEEQLTPPPPPPADGSPVTAVTPMLETASATVVAGPAATELPREPIDGGLLERLSAIELAAGMSATGAYQTALVILAERDLALSRAVRIDPPPIGLDAFQARLEAVIEQVERIHQKSQTRRAA
jgi:intracellular multiplication protein IcmO